MALQVVLVALLWVTAVTFLVAGGRTGCELMLLLGLLHLRDAIALSSAFRFTTDPRGGVTSSDESSRRFWRPQLSGLCLPVGWALCLAMTVSVLLTGFEPLDRPHADHFWPGVLCVIVAIVWFVSGRVAGASQHAGVPVSDDVEKDSRLSFPSWLTGTLNELCLLSLVVLAGLMSGTRWPALVAVMTLALGVWLIALLVEGVVNAAFAVCVGRRPADGIGRESGLRRWLQGRDAAEADIDDWRGFSFLATTRMLTGWRRIAAWWLPAMLVVAWLLSGLVVVRPNERAVYYRLGRQTIEPLQAGLHVLLPKPLSRVVYVPVNQVKTVTVGFHAEAQELARLPLSWTRPHGKAEFPLIIGNGTELVALNGLVQFRVPDQVDVIRRYVSSAEQPEMLLVSMAQRVLTGETRCCTLDELLSGNRADWNLRIAKQLRGRVEELELGLEVVGFELVSVHPPVEVAAAYLDVVSARVDAEKVIAETRAAAASELLRCEMVSHSDIATANASGSDRRADITDETSEMAALSEVDAGASQVVRRRIYCEVLSSELERRPITLIDQHVPARTQIWLESAE